MSSSTRRLHATLSQATAGGYAGAIYGQTGVLFSITRTSFNGNLVRTAVVTCSILGHKLEACMLYAAGDWGLGRSYQYFCYGHAGH
jgi:hypothetical protein